MSINHKEQKEKNLSKQEFKKELSKVKTLLPNHYGVIMRSLHPTIDIRKVYNVVNYGVHDEEILLKLKFILPN